MLSGPFSDLITVQCYIMDQRFNIQCILDTEYSICFLTSRLFHFRREHPWIELKRNVQNELWKVLMQSFNWTLLQYTCISIAFVNFFWRGIRLAQCDNEMSTAVEDMFLVWDMCTHNWATHRATSTSLPSIYI